MCGIIGYVGDRDCVDIIMDGLRRLEYRGYDSAGLAIWDGAELVLRRAQGKLVNLQKNLLLEPVQGSTGIGHTRWATHGRPSEANAHPHRWQDIALVHNGIIENYLELKSDLLARGHEFASETDTEIVAHLIGEEVASGQSLHEAVRRTIRRIEGSFALVVISERSPDQVVVARNQSPLILALGEGENFAASDIPAVLAHSREVVFLEDGETAVLRAQRVEIFDPEGKPIQRAPKRVAWDPISAEKQGYKHFMLKEIIEQPAKLIDTLRGRVSLERGEVVLDGIEFSPEDVKALRRVVIVACGTSYHAGLVAKQLIEDLAGILVEVDVASEFRYRSPLLSPQDLFLSISQSGETADTLAALRLAKSLGAHTLTICNVVDASIPRLSHGALYTHADPEIGVASTKAFTTQLATLSLFAIWLGRQSGRLSVERSRALLEALRHLPQQVEEALAEGAHIKEMARSFIHARSFLYLGRGVNFPIALEGALKLKEISYIHAEAYPAGEMKHGPIALIDEELPVVFVATKTATYDKVFSNLQEVKARGGRVIAVANPGDRQLERHADFIIHVPEVEELLQPILNVVPLQLLAYHIADMKGTDVDQPRNLAKSVTVE